MIYRWLVRPLLFRLDPEVAHVSTMNRLKHWRTGLGIAERWLAPRDPRLRSEVLGLAFPGVVGLAAGLDKHGEATAAWSALGFAFAEIGTVTPRPQPGNPKPRLFRLPADRALVNRLGFNSVGAAEVAENLARHTTRSIPIGVNVGKNRDTPNDSAATDYVQAIRALAPFADYWVVNVSSPNTSGLRDLQHPETVAKLVAAAVAAASSSRPERPAPVLVKLDPDAPDDDRLATASAAIAAGARGLVATNTTVARDGLRDPRASESGGLSGAPLKARADAVVRALYQATGGRVPIIGVGGIFTAADAYARIRSGASLVQVYSGLVYDGPLLAASIHRGLSRFLDRDRLGSIGEAVGLDVS